jgi:hypothetical protein
VGMEGTGGEDEGGGDHGYGDAIGPEGLVVYLGGVPEREGDYFEVEFKVVA